MRSLLQLSETKIAGARLLILHTRCKQKKAKAILLNFDLQRGTGTKIKRFFFNLCAILLNALIDGKS